MPSLIDLHSHSVVSDGTLTPTELVTHAAKQGVKVLALTDHDDVAGLVEARQAAEQRGIQLIHGVEISITWKMRTFHILGLRVDPSNVELLAGLSKIREGRHVRAEGMAAGLARAGIGGSLEGSYAYASGGIISRTHFARFLVEKGHAKDTKAVFKNFLVKGKPGYFEHAWTSLQDAVNWIKGAGGQAIIAHPGRHDLGKTNMLTLFSEFRECGGVGIEVVTGSHTPDQFQQFAKLAHQFDFLSSMGSDYHGPGHNYIEMGRLPDLPYGCVPVWHDWGLTLQ